MAKVKVSRSAVTGKFVTPSFRKTHKRTTVLETVRKNFKRGSKKR